MSNEPLVFTDDFIDDLDRRYAGKPAAYQVDLFFAARSPSRAGLRDWIERAVALVPAPGQAKLISRLRVDEHFVNTLNELAVGAVLQGSFATVLYEQKLKGLTPDWYVPGIGSMPPLIVEVWNKNHAQGAAGRRRGWLALKARVERIEIDVALNVITVARQGPPSTDLCTQIARELRSWLSADAPAWGSQKVIHGYRFHVASTGTQVGHAQMSFPGEGGAFTTADALDEIESKVAKYAAISSATEAAFLVVVAHETGTPISRGTLHDVIRGRQSFEIVFDLTSHGQVADITMPMNAADVPRDFDAALSGIAWVDVAVAAEPTDPPTIHMELFPNPARAVTAPPISGCIVTDT